MTVANDVGAVRGPRRVVVVGGGLAGMAAAVALESAGVNVTLLEARKILGGRAGSFEDPQTGEELDNCQHVVLGCCTNLMDFYRRIGAAEKIRFEPAIRFRDGRGRAGELYGVRGLPAPMHLGPALARFGLLSLGERVALARGMTAMMRLGRSGREKLADVPFGDWLDEHRQSPELVRKMYDVVLVGALNEETRKASAACAIQVFQEALLWNSRGWAMGIPACTLSELYRRLPCRDVRLGVRVAGVEGTSGRVTGVKLASGEIIAADAVVLSTNYHAVMKWVSPEWAERDSRFAGLGKLESVPILGAHLWFDRPVLRESHAALVDGPLQWVFRKDDEGKGVHGVISAARSWVDRDKDEVLKEFEAQVRVMLPDAREAKLVRGVVVVEKRATFSPGPGVEKWRPSQAPCENGVTGLYLAGDYTKTGWPATMEGAVRSGYMAAEAVVAGGQRFLVGDLAVEWPGRLLGASK